MQTQVKYLGHVVSSAGVATDPEKVEAVSRWPRPTDVTQLRAFLGTTGYYHRYVPNYASVAKPLTLLTGEGSTWVWGTPEQSAFDQLKWLLTHAPVLGYPDPTLPYILDTDASNVGTGAVLSQVQEGQERAIAFHSKTLSPAERNYCVTRRELLAVVLSVKHFRPYLYGRKFTIRTDHASLVWLHRRKEPSCQVARWIESLAEHQYQIVHRKGEKHGNADGLSRRQCEDCKQCLSIEKRDGGPTRSEVCQEIWEGVKTPIQRQTAPVELDPEEWPSLPHREEHLSDSPTREVTTNMAAVETRRKLSKIPVIPKQASTKELKELQQQPKTDVGKIYQAVAEDKDIEKEVLQVGSTELRRLVKMYPHLQIDTNGVLTANITENRRMKIVAVCPPAIRQKVIWETHRQAHSGVGRTLKRVQMSWYWPGMTSDVRRTVLSCEVCQQAKHSAGAPTSNRQRLYAGRPWQRLAIDLVGRLPQTARGNVWILVLTDHFTRWSDAIAIPDATAPTVAGVLEERVFCYFGLPEVIHTDQGAQFESDLFQELCRLWGVDKSRTTPYRPEGNGIVERNNRVLGDSLRALLTGRGQEE